MSKGTNTWKVAVTCLLITLAILAVFITVFIVYIVPNNGFSRESIYSVLSRLFPVLIGLILIEVAFLIGRRNSSSPIDNADKLPPNAYDKSLFSKAVDDPQKSEKELKSERERETTPKEDSKERADYRARESEEKSEVIRNMPIEIEKEVIKEVPVEVIREVPVEIIREVYREGTKEVEVPVEIIKRVIVQSEGGSAERESEDQADDIRELTLEEALEEELASSQNGGYTISLCSFEKGQADSIGIDSPVLFDYGEKDAMILPFFTEKEAREKLKGIKGLKATDSSSSKSVQELLSRV